MKKLIYFILFITIHVVMVSQGDSLNNMFKTNLKWDSITFNRAFDFIAELINDDPRQALDKLEFLNAKANATHNTYAAIVAKQHTGMAYNSLSKYTEALKEYIAAVNLCGNKYTDKKYQLYNSIAMVYTKTNEQSRALSYIDQAIAYNKSHQNEKALSLNLNNKAIIFEGQQQFAKALAVHFEAKKIREKQGTTINLAQSCLNISRMYLELGKLDSSLFFAKTSERICDSLNSDLGLSYVHGILSQIFYEQKEYKQAEHYAFRVLKFAEKSHMVEKLMSSNALLYNIYKNQGNYKRALEHRNSYFQYRDSVFNVDNAKKLISVEYENKIALNRKELEIKDKLAKEEKEKQKIIVKAFVLDTILLLGVIALIYFGYRNKKKAALLVAEEKTEVEKQKRIVEEKQKEILDSIHYAKRIQQTLLAHKDFLKEHLFEYFILFKPKDIVSGDFYWATRHGNKFYLAVCDSTGHGVPGAFMSLLNINFLNEAINEKNILEPDKIFDYVRERLIVSVNKDNQKDGFDGILLCFDLSLKTITYSAAHNAPVLVSENRWHELPKDKMPVGAGEITVKFSLFKLDYKSGDVLYVYTDGYADQFGGPKGKKFKYKQLEELIFKNSHLSMNQQEKILDAEFEAWRGNLEQVDDVCVIGIKL